MKISELNFVSHPAGMGGQQAKVNFNNGYGASIITGSHFYSRSECPYEIAVFKNNEIHYNNPIANGNVCGYLTEEEANDILKKIEKFNKNTESKYLKSNG
jgi:hypothetical protein